MIRFHSDRLFRKARSPVPTTQSNFTKYRLKFGSTMIGRFVSHDSGYAVLDARYRGGTKDPQR